MKSLITTFALSLFLFVTAASIYGQGPSPAAIDPGTQQLQADPSPQQLPIDPGAQWAANDHDPRLTGKCDQDPKLEV